MTGVQTCALPIYNGEPNPLKTAEDVRATFSNMAMDDTETVALIGGLLIISQRRQFDVLTGVSV